MQTQSNLHSYTKNKKTAQPQLQRNQPIVLAVDVKTAQAGLAKRMMEALKVYKGPAQEIIPVTLFTPFELGWMIPAKPKLKKHSVENIKEKVTEKWKALGLPHENLGMLASDSNSLRDQAIRLIQFARRKKAEVIAVGSGAKSRTGFTGLGSFTESLISLSTIPVLVVGESLTPSQPVKKILFPTDFSDSSKKAFRTTADLAKKINAEVILFHYMSMETGPLVMGIPWGYEIKWLDAYWSAHEASMKAQGQEWCNWAAKHGIKCELLFDRQDVGLKTRILEVAKEKNVGIIAVCIKRGPFSQVILGGTVRGLFANSECPVLAIHTNNKKRKNYEN